MSKMLHITSVIWPEGKRYVSRCPEIGVSSFGNSPSEARKSLMEAVELWIENARELGLFSEIQMMLEKEAIEHFIVQTKQGKPTLSLYPKEKKYLAVRYYP